MASFHWNASLEYFTFLLPIRIVIRVDPFDRLSLICVHMEDAYEHCNIIFQILKVVMKNMQLVSAVTHFYFIKWYITVDIVKDSPYYSWNFRIIPKLHVLFPPIQSHPANFYCYTDLSTFSLYFLISSWIPTHSWRGVLLYLNIFSMIRNWLTCGLWFWSCPCPTMFLILI